MFFIWNFIANFYQCLIYAHASVYFKKKLKKYAPTLINIMWSGTTIIYIIITLFMGNWRDNLGQFLFWFTFI